MTPEELKKLNKATRSMADKLYAIRAKMPGRGIYAAEAPLVMDAIAEIEQKLRMLGADSKNPIPFE